MPDQLNLFGAPKLPEGFKYEANIISAAEERTLLQQIEELPFRDFELRKLHQADDIPEFLLVLRETAARFAGRKPATNGSVCRLPRATLCLSLERYITNRLGAQHSRRRSVALFGDIPKLTQ